MPLSLEYTFIPNVSPLLVSVADEPPNVIDLQITISNSTMRLITLREIAIEIPMGEDSSRSLSSAAGLPAPAWSTAGAWTIATTGSDLTLKPTTGESASITPTGPLTVLLQAIPVNTIDGKVPLTLTETSASGVKTADSTDYTLTKLSSDMPVTSFFTRPSSVFDIEPVRLHWNCNDLGPNYSYAVSSQGWTAQDCMSNGNQNCLTPADGINGIPTPPLTEDTTFTLQIIDMTSPGNPVVKWTVTVTVPAFLPSIAQQSSMKKLLNGRIVSVHWYTSNVSSCSLQMDSTIVATGLPTDTYIHGFPWCVNDDNEHTFSVLAYALNGSQASAHMSFPPMTVSQPYRLPVPSFGATGTITADSRTALIPSINSVSASEIVSIDLTVTPPAVKPNPFPFDSEMQVNLAVTPDGTLLLLPGLAGLSLIDLPSGTMEATKLPYPGLTGPGLTVAITPDGSLALMPNMFGLNLYVVDIAKRAFLSQTAPLPGDPAFTAIAISPDGSLAVLLQFKGGIAFYDISTLSIEPVKLQVPEVTDPQIGGGIAISADGETAVVCHLGSTVITIVDIPSRTIRGTIPYGAPTDSPAILSSSRLALMIDHYNGVIVAIDVQAVTLLPAVIPVGQFPFSILISPDGRFTILTTSVDGEFAGTMIYESDKGDTAF